MGVNRVSLFNHILLETFVKQLIKSGNVNTYLKLCFFNRKKTRQLLCNLQKGLASFKIRKYKRRGFFFLVKKTAVSRAHLYRSSFSHVINFEVKNMEGTTIKKKLKSYSNLSIKQSDPYAGYKRVSKLNSTEYKFYRFFIPNKWKRQKIKRIGVYRNIPKYIHSNFRMKTKMSL